MNADIFALLFKVSAILLAAAVAALLLRNSSAARRHFVWSAAMTSVVVLVVLQLVVPPIVVPVAQHSPLAAFAQATNRDFAGTANVAPRVGLAALPAQSETSGESIHASSATTVLPNVALPSSARSNAASGNAPQSSISLGLPHTLSESAPAAHARSADSTFDIAAAVARPAYVRNPPPWYLTSSQFGSSPFPSLHFTSLHITPRQLRSMLLGAWFLGSLLLALRLLLAHCQLGRIVRSARAIDGSAQYPNVDRIALRLGVLKPVRLLVHEGVTTPCTAGWRNPLILLPDAFATWDATRQRAVFTHELAHVARNDSVAQTVASLACALFWFHPGFWMVSRLLRAESERAADDCVINSGMAPLDYAAHLVAIAEVSSLHSRIPSVALGMARVSQLELRLRAMLNGQQSRTVITRGAQRAATTVALMSDVPFAGLQARVEPQQPARPAHPASTPLMAQPATPPLPAHGTAPSLPPRPTAPPMPAHGIAPSLPPRSAAQPWPGHGVAPSLPAQPATPPLPVPAAGAEVLSAHAVMAPASPPRKVGPPLPNREGAPPLPVAVETPARLPPYSLPRNKLPAENTDTTYERNVDVVVGDTLVISLPAGGNVTIHGWDEPGARLRAQLGGKYWSETRVAFATIARGLQLLAFPEIHGMRMHSALAEGYTYARLADSVMYVPTTIDNEFELWIPRRMSVKFMAPVGVLTANGVRGDIQRARTTVGVCITQLDPQRWRVRMPGAVTIVDGNVQPPKTEPIIIVDGVVQPRKCESN